MIKEQNIVLDFTNSKTIEKQLGEQPLAIMPAHIAEKLLTLAAEQMIKASSKEIIEDHIVSLENIVRSGKGLNEAVRESIEWIQERELIHNIASGAFDSYRVVR